MKEKDMPQLLGTTAHKYKSRQAAYKALAEKYPDDADVQALAKEKSVAKYNKIGSPEDGYTVFKDARALKRFATAEEADAHIAKSKAADAKKAGKK